MQPAVMGRSADFNHRTNCQLFCTWSLMNYTITCCSSNWTIQQIFHFEDVIHFIPSLYMPHFIKRKLTDCIYCLWWEADAFASLIYPCQERRAGSRSIPAIGRTQRANPKRAAAITMHNTRASILSEPWMQVINYISRELKNCLLKIQ